MSSMKDLYYNVQEMLLEGKSVYTVATAFELPVSVVREMQQDMDEYADEFEGNLE